jgi:hypothetical protein
MLDLAPQYPTLSPLGMSRQGRGRARAREQAINPALCLGDNRAVPPRWGAAKDQGAASSPERETKTRVLRPGPR